MRPLDARDDGKLTREMLVARAAAVKALGGQAARGRVGRGKSRPRADCVFLRGGGALARVLQDVLSQCATCAPPFTARGLSLIPVTPKLALRARWWSRRSSGVRDVAWREEGGLRVAEGYEGDTLYHMRPLGAQNLEKLPAEVLVARSVALRVVKGEHRKGGKRGGRATRAESVLLRVVERMCARRIDIVYIEPPYREGAGTHTHTSPLHRHAPSGDNGGAACRAAQAVGGGAPTTTRWHAASRRAVVVLLAVGQERYVLPPSTAYGGRTRCANVRAGPRAKGPFGLPAPTCKVPHFRVPHYLLPQSCPHCVSCPAPPSTFQTPRF